MAQLCHTQPLEIINPGAAVCQVEWKPADRPGVTRKTVNTIEKGLYVPSTVLVLKLARVFGVSVEDVFQLAEPFPV